MQVSACSFVSQCDFYVTTIFFINYGILLKKSIMYVMLEQYHFLKCEEQFFSSNIINSPYRGLTAGTLVCVISSFGCDVKEICVLLGYYTAYSGNSVPTFWDKLLLPSSSFLENWFQRSLKMRPIGCLEMSVRNYHCTLCNNPEERKSLFFSSKCHLFHNATFFGFCIIHICIQDVLKFKCK